MISFFSLCFLFNFLAYPGDVSLSFFSVGPKFGPRFKGNFLSFVTPVFTHQIHLSLFRICTVNFEKRICVNEGQIMTYVMNSIEMF